MYNKVSKIKKGTNIMNKNITPQISPRDKYTRQISSARIDLVLLVMLSVINIIFLFTESQTYFLFSAYIPYTLASLGVVYSGNLPDIYYEGYEGMTKEDFILFDDSVMYVLLAIAAVILAVYLLCFVFSKKKMGWLIAATVLFAADTVYLLYNVVLTLDFAGYIMDIVLHAYVMYCLIAGLIAAKKLSTLPEDEPITENGEIGANATERTDADEVADFNKFDSDNTEDK